MKKSLLLAILFVGGFSFSLSAQQYKQEADLIKSIVGQAKKDFIVSMVDIPDDKANTFWECYNAYDTKRQSYGVERVNLVSRYVDMYDDLSRKDNVHLVSSAFKLSKQSDKNMKKYFKKMAKKVSPETAMQWVQVEQYLRTAIDNAIYGDLPLK